jgi:hypothetical protein
VIVANGALTADAFAGAATGGQFVAHAPVQADLFVVSRANA